LQTRVVQKIKTCILFSLGFSEKRAMYETVRKHKVEPNRPQMTIYTVNALGMLDNWG